MSGIGSLLPFRDALAGRKEYNKQSKRSIALTSAFESIRSFFAQINIEVAKDNKKPPSDIQWFIGIRNQSLIHFGAMLTRREK